MAFKLGNFTVDEVLYAVAEDFDGNLLYVLDQLSAANIEISAESTDITDKKGNIIRTTYKSKTGTFNSTNALLHPAAMNAASGNDILEASAESKLPMPKMIVVPAGATVTLDEKEGTVKVIGMYGNGANGKALTQSTAPDYETGKFGLTEHSLKVPEAAEGNPTQYLVMYEREVESGIVLVNTADKFPNTVRLTLFCSIVDPCDDTLKACYVYIPSFMADPSMTISMDSESQEMDFNGKLQMDYCGTEKTLYRIYFPDEDAIVTGIAA